jgi:CBS domain-containing membrane protein
MRPDPRPAALAGPAADAAEAQGFSQWLRAFWPAPITVSRRELVLGVAGAFLGVLSAAWFSRWMLHGLNPWFVAPMGASAVLLFAVPSSPLAQPWSIVGGNLVAASIGVACAQAIADVPLACGAAAGLAIGAMFALRCLHPPSGAVALTAVVGGPAITALGWRFVFWPVAANSLLLLLAALVFNVAARRRYPHRPLDHANTHQTRDRPPSARLGLTVDDLHGALKARGELLDVSEDDLEELFIEAEHRAWRRRFGEIRCADVMSRDVVAVRPSTSTEHAWQLMLRHSIKALPVVDPDRVLLGIVTMHDFFVDRARAGTSGQPRTAVMDLMTTQVLTTRPEQTIVDLTATFSDGGRHHLPVVDDQHRLVGMVTQSDMVAALYRAGLERPA